MGGRPRGFVLVLVLFALVFLAALASAGLFEALQELRIGRNLSEDVRLREAAESGLAAGLASWDPRAAPDSGGRTVLPGAGLAGFQARVDVIRLSARLLLLRSVVRDADGSNRQVEQIARLVGPEPPAEALRARTADPIAVLRAGGSDAPPAGWRCAAAADSARGAVLYSGALDSLLFRFGAMDWNALAQWAGSRPPGGDSLPVVYQPADTSLTGGSWAGTLVVGGNLTLRGGVSLTGLVVTRGTLLIGAGGASVLGSVTASQVIVDQSVTEQQLHFGYSSCAVLGAVLAGASPQPLWGVPVWGVY